MCVGVYWLLSIGVRKDFFNGVWREDGKEQNPKDTQGKSSQGSGECKFKGPWQGACLVLKAGGWNNGGGDG